MASRNIKSLTAWSLLATALSGLAWWFGSGLTPNAWLTWLAPLPILLLAPQIGWRWAALAAAAAGACAGLNQWHYLHDIIGLPLPVDLLVVIAPAATFALCVAFFRLLWRRGRVVSAALAMPALWGAIEFLGAMSSPHGTFGNVGYTQMDMLPVIQIAALAGIWGISFALLLVPSALAVVLLPGPPVKLRALVGFSAAALLAATLAFGHQRLQAPATSSLRIGLLALQGPVRAAPGEPAGQAQQQRYLEAIDRAAAQGARVVVLPETSFVAAATALLPALADSANRHALTLDVGVALSTPSQREQNAAWVFEPGAASPAAYRKHHLIPGFEDNYLAGTDFTMLPASPSIGLAICKDMDFHDIGNAYAARGAQLLLVPAWDFGADGWLHSRMAVLRGVESGFAIARSARSGRLTLSDDRGRVVAEASSEKQDAELVANLPLRSSTTLYSRWGNWFAWLNLALLLGLLLGLLLRSARAARTP